MKSEKNILQLYRPNKEKLCDKNKSADASERGVTVIDTSSDSLIDQNEDNFNVLSESDIRALELLIQKRNGKICRECDRAAMIEDNMVRLVYPLIDTIQEYVSPAKRSLITLLRSCLKDIMSPIIHELVSQFSTLSPAETAICDMISKGYSSKQIASLRDISVLTVNDHRKSIRKKLGLTETKINLVSYLESLAKSRP